jgi:predicted transcriptional regulator of viral defense system
MRENRRKEGTMTYVRVSDDNKTVAQCAEKHGGRYSKESNVYEFEESSAAEAFTYCVRTYSGGQTRAEFVSV